MRMERTISSVCVGQKPTIERGTDRQMTKQTLHSTPSLHVQIYKVSYKPEVRRANNLSQPALPTMLPFQPVLDELLKHAAKRARSSWSTVILLKPLAFAVAAENFAVEVCSMHTQL